MGVNIKKDFGNTRNRKPDITNLVYGKVPPQAVELEYAVLGAIMLERDKLDEVVGIIPESECFYADANQKIYEAVLRLFRSGSQVDLLTVTEELRKSNELEIVGGAYYLTRLTMSVVSSAHVEAHARIVMEKFMQRELIRVSGQTIGEAYDDSTDVFDLMNNVESELDALKQNFLKQDVHHISALSPAVTQDVVEMRERRVEFTGVSTGFETMDRVTGGWQKSDLIILAARPAVGKTSFVLNIAKNAALCRRPAAIFSLEMRFSQLVQRLQSETSGVPLKSIKLPIRMSDKQFEDYIKADKTLSQLPIYIDDTSFLSFNDLRTKARKLKKKAGIELIIIDYLQLMQGDKKSGNREQEISKITRDLKALAKELDIPIIALSQLNRVVESNKDNRPKLSHLRESGAIEQDADVVILMYRATKEEEGKTPELRGPVNFDIAKHRNGDTEEVILYFEREIQKWHNSNPYFNIDQPDVGTQFPVSNPNQNYKTMYQASQQNFFTNPPAGGFQPGAENVEDLPF